MRHALLLALMPVLALAREVRLLRLEGPDTLPGRLFVIGPGVESELDVLMLSPSTRRASIGKEACVLHLAKDKPTPKQPLPADAPAVQIPAGEGDLLVLLLSGPGSLGIRALPVTLPDARGAAGALLWFNLQPRTLHVGLGNAQPVAVRTGTCGVTLPPVPPDAPYAARLDLDPVDAGQDIQPFVRATWVRARYGRHLSFVLTDPDRLVPRIISVPDIDAPPEPVIPAPGAATKK